MIDLKFYKCLWTRNEKLIIRILVFELWNLLSLVDKISELCHSRTLASRAKVSVS